MSATEVGESKSIWYDMYEVDRYKSESCSPVSSVSIEVMAPSSSMATIVESSAVAANRTRLELSDREAAETELGRSLISGIEDKPRSSSECCGCDGCCCRSVTSSKIPPKAPVDKRGKEYSSIEQLSSTTGLSSKKEAPSVSFMAADQVWGTVE